MSATLHRRRREERREGRREGEERERGRREGEERERKGRGGERERRGREGEDNAYQFTREIYDNYVYSTNLIHVLEVNRK